MDRRDFLRTTMLAGAAMTLAPRATSAADARVDVLLDEPIARIDPNVYGHFVEHLGGVVYDGIWVGEGSRIPNTGGIRQAIVDHMRHLPKGVIRWPGGCFADSYDWRDGIGPREARPRRTNFWTPEMAARPDGPWKYDPNHFGTNEFVRFVRLCGGEPYLAANLRSLPARDFYQWVEYANSPAGSTTLAEMRAKGGSAEPLRVRFWGVGNESWGCGGNLTADEYAVEYRKFTAWLPTYGEPLSFIGSGPNGNDLSWTRRFFTTLTAKGEGALNSIWGWALHHYTWNASRGATTDWNAGKGDALVYTTDEWYEILAQAAFIETLITGHWAVMGEIDRRHRVKIVVDEWGTWHKPGTEIHPSHHLGQQSTIRDALVAALTLDTFHRHADKVAMANIAQLVNCLQSLFLTDGERFLLTPTYHVFALYAPHAGGEAVRTQLGAPRIGYDRVNDRGSVAGLAGSASVRDRTVTLTLVNPHATDATDATITLRGGRAASARAVTIAAGEIHAHNTFDRPAVVAPSAESAVPVGPGASFTHRLPPASVTRLTVALG
ncbi:alpha-N-arabinofuranosidase [Luteitalea sp. TBR-22]|uniref:alpha-N-arabinofuranosidase n=1 Tax=Luteitalea sp. TBR-22 TaxID=2802971 RepID=UPI001AF4CA27|nr:alpha-L-arabinofuranosidase C-terminal domain-containing protein [Luteitalea sp. TBR-22]BCS31059.1 alpha-N-arabinofuranosidase [Luteitalea sp. TBR-22]